MNQALSTAVSTLLNPELHRALQQLMQAQDVYDLCVVDPRSRETGTLNDAILQIRESAYDVVAILRGDV